MNAFLDFTGETWQSLPGGPVLDLFLRGGGRYVFTGLDPVMPFIGLGLAVHRWSTETRNLTDGSMTGVTDVNLGIDVSGGARIGISDSFSLEALVHIGQVFEHSVFHDRSATFFSLLAGFAYHI